MSTCPIDYSFCNRTVTIYRKQKNQVLRQVIENAYFQRQEQQKADTLGQSTRQKFLLILPGNVQNVFPGDWVMDGVGPEAANWCEVTQKKGAGEVSYAEAYYWDGVLCHMEAGRK